MIKSNFTEDTKNHHIERNLVPLKRVLDFFWRMVNAFLRISRHKNTLVIRTKLNKTAWKILKANKNKRNIQAPKLN